MPANRIYVFDAYGTLFDVHSAVARHREEVGPQADRLSELWRTKQLEYSWVRSLMGRYKDFFRLTQEALDFAASRIGGISPGLHAKLLYAYEEPDAFADVLPTLTALKAAGAKTAILSNGTPDMLQSAVNGAKMDHLLDACLSVDAIQTFKTRPEAYALVTDHFHVKPEAVVFVSSNRWDVAGARAFGFHPVWINRTEQNDEYGDLPPMRQLTRLDAQGLMA